MQVTTVPCFLNMESDPLSPWQQELILSLFPHGTQIIEARYFQREYLPCPMRVQVRLPTGNNDHVVLRLSRSSGGVEREARLLPILAKLGLNVPKVLAGPIADSHNASVGSITILSLLRGENLQTWSCASAAGLATASHLLLEGVARLHRLTAPLMQDNLAPQLPHNDMLTELNSIATNDRSQWTQEPYFISAIKQLKVSVATIKTPLVFSNGDYQPGNFLADGKVLTGFVDFERACFEDPHIGFAKYRIYDLHPLNKAGFITRYLQTHDLTEQDFAPRLAVRCLHTLQREVPIEEKDGGYALHLLALLRQALDLIS